MPFLNDSEKRQRFRTIEEIEHRTISIELLFLAMRKSTRSTFK